MLLRRLTVEILHIQVHIVREIDGDMPQEYFAQRLSTRELEADPALKDSSDPDERNRYYRSVTLERVLELLLRNLTTVPAPNLAHYVLGYNIENVRESDLASHRVPLHIIVDMVSAGMCDNQGVLGDGHRWVVEHSE